MIVVKCRPGCGPVTATALAAPPCYTCAAPVTP